jgi:hypothetical protein
LTDVFVSHAEQDAGWAAQLAGRLRGHGLRVFLEGDVLPGDVLVHVMERAIGKAAYGIAVISPALLAARQSLETEVYAALFHAPDAQRRVIPVLIGGVAAPPLAGNRVWRDFTDAHGDAFDRKAAELAAVISGRAAGNLRYQENPVVIETPRAPDPPAERAFVVCYTQDNAAYCQRLAGQLRDAGLPAWSVADLLPGDDWTRKVRRQLGDAIAVLVLMSPRSQDSGGITRMILEGQLRGRPFVPFLLAGDVNYHLADTWYFDARQGQLPDAGLLGLLRQLHEADAGGEKADTARLLPPPLAPSGATAIRVPAAAGLDQLNRYLSEGQFGYADLQTTALLLEAAGRSAEKWLRRDDGRKLPLALISGIDALWSRHCDGRQGFRAQLAYCEVSNGRHAEFVALSVACGWQDTQDASVCGDYEEFIKRADGDGREGFYPTLRSPLGSRHDWYDLWEPTVLVIHRRLQELKGAR